MYTGIALRANSSFSYKQAEVTSPLSSELAFYGFSLNPRFLLYGYCLRQSALISWAPSKPSLSSWVGSRCCRPCLRDWEVGRRIGRSSDESFNEMIGLLAEVRGCDRESFGVSRLRYGLGSSEFGCSARESKSGEENGWSLRREDCRGVPRTESIPVCHPESSSGWSDGELGCGECGNSVRKWRRDVVIESGGGRTWLSSRREDCRGVRRNGSSLVCHCKLDGDSGRGERLGQSVRKLGREVVIQSGRGENGLSLRREDRRGARRDGSNSVCHCNLDGDSGRREKFGQSVRKLGREVVIESGGGENERSQKREDHRCVRRNGSSSVCHSKLDGDSGRGEFGQSVRKLRREVVIESGGGENERSLRREDRRGVRRNDWRSVCSSGMSSDWSGSLVRGESRRGRRVGGEFSQGSSGELDRDEGGGEDVEEKEFQEVWKYEDDAQSKRSRKSKDSVGWDSKNELAFRERDDNSRALHSKEFAAEWEARNSKERAAPRLHLAHGVREGHDYSEQNVVRQRDSREESRRLLRTSEARGNDTRRTSSSINIVDARKVDRKEGSTSAINGQSEIDERVVGQAGWDINDREEEADRLMGSAHGVIEDHGYEELHVAGQNESTGYQKLTRSAVHGNETRRASSSKNRIDARMANRAEGSMSAARWRSGTEQRVAGRAERQNEDREERGALSIGFTHEEGEDYVDGEEHVSRQWESREGSQKVLTISEVHEDDSKRVSSSKNMVDGKKISRESNSMSAIKHHAETDQQVVEQTESRRSSQNFREISEAYRNNIQRASKSQRHFEETRLKDREDTSTSVQVTRDRRVQTEQKLVGRTELNEKYEDHADISRVYTRDAAKSVSSQSLHDSRLDDEGDHSASVVNLVHRARRQQNETTAQFTKQASARREYQTHDQIFEFSRSDNERASNSQEIYNTRLENESVSRQYGSRRESEKDAEVSMYSRSDVRRIENESVSLQYGSRRESEKDAEVSEYSRSDVRRVTQERYDSRINDHGENSSTLLVRGRMDRQRSTLTGESSESTKTKKVYTRSLGSSSSGYVYPHTRELDDQTSSDEMQIVKDGALESARLLDKSSAIYVGEFVDKLQQELITTEELKSQQSSESHMEEMQPGTTQATSGIGPSVFDPAKTDKDGRYTQEGGGGSSSVSGMKGPSDEMWDVRGFTSEGTSRIQEHKEDSSAAGVADTQTTTTTSENAITQRSHRSLWTYIAGVIRLGFGHRSESETSMLKSGPRSSSNESLGSETWFSGQDVDVNDDNIDKKGKTVTPKESSPMRRPVDYPRRTHSAPSQQGLEAPKVVNRMVMSKGATSASMRSLVGGSLSKHASLVSGPEDAGQIEGEKGKQDIYSSIVRVDQPSSLTDNTCSTTVGENIVAIGNVQMPVSSHSQSEEELVGRKPPAVDQTEGKDGELKRRKLQRNKQVLRERFDEWEEAYIFESEQRKMDEFFMREALVEAQKAADTWEVPVGAVLVQDGKIIARGCNFVEELRDSTAHAEMICIRQASNLLRTWRLAGTTLYVTLEPCPMCAGAILQARIDTVVWGAPNKLLGADGSWVRLFPGDGGSNSLDPSNQMTGPVHPFHPKISIRRGVLSTECSEVMQQFFQLRRKSKKPEPQRPPSLPLAPHPVKFFTKIHNIFSMMFCL